MLQFNEFVLNVNFVFLQTSGNSQCSQQMKKKLESCKGQEELQWKLPFVFTQY